MIRITLKSNKNIDLTNEQVEKILSENIESIVEDNLSECACKLNESENFCSCDGGVSDDDYSIKFISVVYVEGEDGK